MVIRERVKFLCTVCLHLSENEKNPLKKHIVVLCVNFRWKAFSECEPFQLSFLGPKFRKGKSDKFLLLQQSQQFSLMMRPWKQFICRLLPSSSIFYSHLLFLIKYRKVKCIFEWKIENIIRTPVDRVHDKSFSSLHLINSVSADVTDTKIIMENRI